MVAEYSKLASERFSKDTKLARKIQNSRERYKARAKDTKLARRPSRALVAKEAASLTASFALTLYKSVARLFDWLGVLCFIYHRNNIRHQKEL